MTGCLHCTVHVHVYVYVQYLVGLVLQIVAVSMNLGKTSLQYFHESCAPHSHNIVTNQQLQYIHQSI